MHDSSVRCHNAWCTVINMCTYGALAKVFAALLLTNSPSKLYHAMALVFAGNSGLSWSDVLLGDMPNVYVYAANNPSESILAKRRGYGTIISHNVPPYARSASQFV